MLKQLQNVATLMGLTAALMEPIPTTIKTNGPVFISGLRMPAKQYAKRQSRMRMQKQSRKINRA